MGNGRVALEDVLADISHVREMLRPLVALMDQEAHLRPCAVALERLVVDILPAVEALQRTVRGHYAALEVVLEALDCSPAELVRRLRRPQRQEGTEVGCE